MSGLDQTTASSTPPTDPTHYENGSSGEGEKREDNKSPQITSKRRSQSSFGLLNELQPEIKNNDDGSTACISLPNQDVSSPSAIASASSDVAVRLQVGTLPTSPIGNLGTSSSHLRPLISYSGEVRKQGEQLVSDSPVIDMLLKYVRANTGKGEQSIDDLPDINEELTLTLDDAAWPDFRFANNVTKVKVKAYKGSPNLKDENIKANTSIIALLETLLKKVKKEAKEGAKAKIDATNNTTSNPQSPCDYLSSLPIKISSTNENSTLAKLINKKIAADPSLRAKLNAAPLLQTATHQHFAPWQLAGGLAVTLGLGALWEFCVSPLVRKKLFGQDLASATLAKEAEWAAPDAVMWGLICVLETFIGLAAIKVIQGEQDWSWKELAPKVLITALITACSTFGADLLGSQTSGSTFLNVLASIVVILAIELAAIAMGLDFLSMWRMRRLNCVPLWSRRLMKKGWMSRQRVRSWSNMSSGESIRL